MQVNDPPPHVAAAQSGAQPVAPMIGPSPSTSSPLPDVVNPGEQTRPASTAPSWATTLSRLSPRHAGLSQEAMSARPASASNASDIDEGMEEPTPPRRHRLDGAPAGTSHPGVSQQHASGAVDRDQRDVGHRWSVPGADVQMSNPESSSQTARGTSWQPTFASAQPSNVPSTSYELVAQYPSRPFGPLTSVSATASVEADDSWMRGASTAALGPPPASIDAVMQDREPFRFRQAPSPPYRDPSPPVEQGMNDDLMASFVLQQRYQRSLGRPAANSAQTGTPAGQTFSLQLSLDMLCHSRNATHCQTIPRQAVEAFLTNCHWHCRGHQPHEVRV